MKIAKGYNIFRENIVRRNKYEFGFMLKTVYSFYLIFKIVYMHKLSTDDNT